MNRLLLTGLTGKSGSVFAQEIAACGLSGPYRLRAAVRETSDITALRACLPEAELCPGDLTDRAYLRELTAGVDILFHVAGIHWSWPLVEAAAENGVKRMVLVHTTGIYSKYKAAGEEYREIEAKIDALAQAQGIAITYLRPTMIFGNLRDGNMAKYIRMVDRFSPMPVVSHAAYLLQPVHYSDLGRAYRQVLEHLSETAGKSYILSGERPLTLMEIFQLIAADLGVTRRYLSVPFPIAYAGAWGVYLVSLTKVDLREKVQRLCESRDFPHGEAARDFGYAPAPFADGLAAEVAQYLAAKNA